jgi:hypothetical protein
MRTLKVKQPSPLAASNPSSEALGMGIQPGGVAGQAAHLALT